MAHGVLQLGNQGFFTTGLFEETEVESYKISPVNCVVMSDVGRLHGIFMQTYGQPWSRGLARKGR